MGRDNQEKTRTLGIVGVQVLRSISSCVLGLWMQTKWTRFIPEPAHYGQEGEVTNISEGASNEKSKVK